MSLTTQTYVKATWPVEVNETIPVTKNRAYYQKKSFITNVTAELENAEQTVQTLIEHLDSHDYYLYETYSETYLHESKTYNGCDFRSDINKRLSYLKESLEYLTDNYTEIKKRLGMPTLILDNKSFEAQVNELSQDVEKYRNKLYVIV